MQPKTPGPPAIERSLTPSRGGGQWERTRRRGGGKWQRSRKPPGCPCPRWAGSRSLRPTRRRRPSRGNASTFVDHHGQRSVRSGEVDLPERGSLATSPFRLLPAADRSGARGAGRPLPAKGPPPAAVPTGPTTLPIAPPAADHPFGYLTPAIARRSKPIAVRGGCRRGRTT